jgi:hypothetical protein
VDSTVQYISKYHTSATFPVNQNGKTITQDYEGKIYVADFSLPLADHLSKMTANLFEVKSDY